MKYLRTYENYKSSQKYGDKLTVKEFNDLYNKYCKNHKSQKISLYRGLELKNNEHFNNNTYLE